MGGAPRRLCAHRDISQAGASASRLEPAACPASGGSQVGASPDGPLAGVCTRLQAHWDPSAARCAPACPLRRQVNFASPSTLHTIAPLRVADAGRRVPDMAYTPRDAEQNPAHSEGDKRQPNAGRATRRVAPAQSRRPRLRTGHTSTGDRPIGDGAGHCGSHPLGTPRHSTTARSGNAAPADHSRGWLAAAPSHKHAYLGLGPADIADRRRAAGASSRRRVLDGVDRV